MLVSGSPLVLQCVGSHVETQGRSCQGSRFALQRIPSNVMPQRRTEGSEKAMSSDSRHGFGLAPCLLGDSNPS